MVLEDKTRSPKSELKYPVECSVDLGEGNAE